MAKVHIHHYPKALNEPMQAKDKMFRFTPSDSYWSLAEKSAYQNIDISFMHNADLSNTIKFELLDCLAIRATSHGASTFVLSKNALKSFLFVLHGENFSDYESAFNSLPQNTKEQLSGLIKNYYKHRKQFKNNAISEFYRKVIYKLRPLKRDNKTILDPVKGALTKLEFESYFEGLRQLHNKVRQLCKLIHEDDCTVNGFYSEGRRLGQRIVMSGGVGMVLLTSVLRRPVQLEMIKTCDFRMANGDYFGEKVTDYTVADYDELKLKTYRAKDGTDARTELDKDIHLINADISETLILYMTMNFKIFINSMSEHGVELSKTKKKDLFTRFPLFPSVNLLKGRDLNGFPLSEESLFSQLSKNTVWGHLAYLTREMTITEKQEISPYFKSERFDNPKEMTVGNNRFRHTVQTNLAVEGVPSGLMAAMAGITDQAAQRYVSLAPQAREQINKAFSNNEILNRFGKLTIQEVVQDEDFIAFNEFGDEFGVMEDKMRCEGCKSKLPVPLGCYPCRNFRPLANADHQSQLDKANLKYSANKKAGASDRALQKLIEVIAYIQVTIKKCAELKELSHGK